MTGKDHDSQRPRVVVVDDSSQTRQTFQQAFPGLEVVGTYDSVDALLLASPGVDLVVLDLQLSSSFTEPTLQGPRAIQELSDRSYRVCIYSDELRLLVLAKCFSAGAHGLARKVDSIEANQATFLKVAAGQIVVPPSMVGLVELLSRRKSLPDLTTRQVEVLTARARGEAWDAIGRRLGISAKTAQRHFDAVVIQMTLFLRETRLDPEANPADIERVLGLAPGDLDDPRARWQVGSGFTRAAG